jgi:uncharacterized ferritin-like protein (DUF455 family)
MNSSHHRPIFDLALGALAANGIDLKLEAIDALAAAIGSNTAVPPTPTFEPFFAHQCVPERGVPVRPLRVEPGAVPQRKPNTREGRAALLHAIAHIEFSAIDLALDHALRFPGFPAAYYADWLNVAIEEASHFRMLRQHLLTLGHDYGDFPVHDSLWQMAERTATDPLARMALVPRLLEARGLDATPPIQQKLAAVGDREAVRLLDIILRDEVGHVGLGDKWFRVLCTERKLEPEATFRELIRQHRGPWPQSPLNRSARLAAGFSENEIDAFAKT